MAKLEILKFPDPRLRKLSHKVEEVTPELKKFSEDMMETMYDEKGIGLAAPQVNRLIRLILIDTRPQKEGQPDLEGLSELEKNLSFPLVLFNPEVISKEGQTTYEEGCLSLPGYFETVKRADLIEVKALNQQGEGLQFKVDGLTAICIQHEIDHLDGKLFIDRLSLIKANRVKAKIKKLGYPKKEEESEGESL